MLSNVKGAAGAALILVGAPLSAQDRPSADAPRLEASVPPPVPSDEANAPSYDQVGLAGVAPVRPGRRTATNEADDPAGFTAAHRTLPLGAYVEVTELDGGRTVLARVNDRGPFGGDRLIDLSPATAAALGIDRSRAVRVRRTSPNIADRTRLAAGGEPLRRLDAPPVMLTALRRRLPGGAAAAPTAIALPPSTAAGTPPVPAAPASAADGMPEATLRPPATPSSSPTPTPPARPARPAAPPAPAVTTAAGRYTVQAGAFASEANARALARRLGGSVERAGTLWRVRLGPYRSQAEAASARSRAAARGVPDARVTTID